MTPPLFPGSMYVLSLDLQLPKLNIEGTKVRLAHVNTEDGKLIALFTDKERANKWREENAPTNSVFKPFLLTPKSEILALLYSLQAPTKAGGSS